MIALDRKFTLTAFGKTFEFTGQDIHNQLSGYEDEDLLERDYREALIYTIIEPIVETPFTEEELNELCDLLVNKHIVELQITGKTEIK